MLTSLKYPHKQTSRIPLAVWRTATWEQCRAHSHTLARRTVYRPWSLHHLTHQCLGCSPGPTLERSVHTSPCMANVTSHLGASIRDLDRKIEHTANVSWRTSPPLQHYWLFITPLPFSVWPLCPLTPNFARCDISVLGRGTWWNWEQIFIMWVVTADKVFKVRSQAHMCTNVWTL